MDAISSADLIRLFDSWKTLFAQKREELIALDGKVGDSDLGITMAKAFAAAAEAVAAEGEAAGIGKLLKTAGATMARTAPSTMGTLTATGFIRAGKALDGVSAIGPGELATFWGAFRDGVAERGKAKPGDKTLLDVLGPLAAAAEAAENSTLGSATSEAAKAAEAALEATKSMKAQHGKAAAFQDRTVGLQDAGATVGLLLAVRMSQFVSAAASD
jgi:phosphoenolpyruvate---glycerone phosphotransferase subunit DhaL